MRIKTLYVIRRILTWGILIKPIATQGIHMKQTVMEGILIVQIATQGILKKQIATQGIHMKQTVMEGILVVQIGTQGILEKQIATRGILKKQIATQGILWRRILLQRILLHGNVLKVIATERFHCTFGGVERLSLNKCIIIAHLCFFLVWFVSCPAALNEGTRSTGQKNNFAYQAVGWS